MFNRAIMSKIYHLSGYYKVMPDWQLRFISDCHLACCRAEYFAFSSFCLLSAWLVWSIAIGIFARKTYHWLMKHKLLVLAVFLFLFQLIMLFSAEFLISGMQRSCLYRSFLKSEKKALFPAIWPATLSMSQFLLYECFSLSYLGNYSWAGSCKTWILFTQRNGSLDSHKVAKVFFQKRLQMLSLVFLCALLGFPYFFNVSIFRPPSLISSDFPSSDTAERERESSRQLVLRSILLAND